MNSPIDMRYVYGAIILTSGKITVNNRLWLLGGFLPHPTLLTERSPALRAGDLLCKSSVAVAQWERGTRGKLHLQIESARMASMDEIFKKLIDSNFSDLNGLTVDASVPVPQYIVNEIIEAALQGNKNIEHCRVSIRVIF